MNKRNLDDFAGIASDWFWETDSEHCFTYFSDRFKYSTSVESCDLLGKSRFELAEPDDVTPHWQAHFDALENHQPFHAFEYSVVRPDKSVIWVRVSGEPRFDEKTGQFLGYRGTGQNVTEEKNNISRLEEANAALQQRNHQLSRARSALERSAHEDPLTGVFNRRAFDRDVQDLMACADRNAGLLQIDLDHFKWINDTLGHMAGDAVLKITASRIKRAADAFGTTYRTGGDEFIIVLWNHVTETQAMQLGHRITQMMSEPVMIGQRSVSVGVSIGVAVSPWADVSATDLIRQADAALYEAKSRGRNTVYLANARLRQNLQKYTWIAADLPHAIQRNQLVPYYQPQRDLSTGEIIGVEALVRWHHPERGIIYPREFLKVAGDLAINDEIDRHMLRLGLAMVDRLYAQDIALPSLSINTSQARLLDPRLIADVGCMWTNRACSLSLELLETISFDDWCDHAQLSSNLDRLRAMGVRIETDDFGSARASITGLLRVLPHRLKIDKHLVQEVTNNPDKHNILLAILDLARGLNIQCMAEGAEDRNALDVLFWLGCTQVQGFAVAKPMQEAELFDFLARERLAPAGTRPVPKKKTAGHMGLPQSA